MHKCTSGEHEWANAEDARRCCNGWVRLRAPIFYGQKEFLGRPISGEMHSFNLFWTFVLVEETNTEEITALRRTYAHRVNIAH